MAGSPCRDGVGGTAWPDYITPPPALFDFRRRLC